MYNKQDFKVGDDVICIYSTPYKHITKNHFYVITYIDMSGFLFVDNSTIPLRSDRFYKKRKKDYRKEKLLKLKTL